MRLRNQLLALSLLTLLLPWSGWKLAQELENFLREGEENALLASARTVAQALPERYQDELTLARGRILPLRQLSTAPILDGYIDEWPESEQNLVFESAIGELKLSVLAGRYGNRLYLAMQVTDPGEIQATTFNAGTAEPDERAGIVLYLQSSRSQHGFMIATEAPGPLVVTSQGVSGSRLEAAWIDSAGGYQLEVSLPGDVDRISVGAVAPAFTMQGVSSERHAGTLRGRQQGEWLELVNRADGVNQWLAHVVADDSRAWLVQADGWVMADSGPVAAASDSELTWVQRMIYQGIADSRMALREDRALWPVKFDTSVINGPFSGVDGMYWSRDPESAAVYSLVAVPVFDGQSVAGAIVMEARSEGLLLSTNRAMGRLLFITLLLVFLIASGLWLFASRLSVRVQKLSGAVSRAMDNAGQVPELPQTSSADELGELARNTEKLLRAVADYTHYLQKLASRLSHELKTPLAITRSSLDNLSDYDLDPEARQYLLRAREGLDRQSAIVRAMSEAQRLEQSVKTTEWASIDLGKMLGHSVDAYRSLHPSRQINLNLPDGVCELKCAPDLISQALDKLVDNAITLSTDDCNIDVSLTCTAQECVIAVSNEGTQLPDVLHEQLFDSLVSLREKGGGGQHLGLGLHIVKLVAQAHGGTAKARNLPDQSGVEFTIRLPHA